MEGEIFKGTDEGRTPIEGSTVTFDFPLDSYEQGAPALPADNDLE